MKKWIPLAHSFCQSSENESGNTRVPTRYSVFPSCRETPNSPLNTSRTSANSARHLRPKEGERLASSGMQSLTITPPEHFFQPISEPSGRIRVCAITKPAFLAPDRSAPDRSAPDKLARYRSAPDRRAPDRLSPDRLAPDRAARDRLAPDRLARYRSAP